jgi:hypothetical protein
MARDTGAIIKAASDDRPSCLPNEFDNDFDFLLSSGVGNVERAKNKRLAWHQGSDFIQRSLTYHGILRAHTGLLLGNTRLRDLCAQSRAIMNPIREGLYTQPHIHILHLRVGF